MIDWTSLTPLDPGGVTVGPAEAHPAFADPDYVRRRNLIADRARGHRVGEPSPPVRYTEAEHATWRKVHRTLLRAQDGRICPQLLRAREAAPIPTDGVPQHEEVSDALQGLTGFRFTLAGGIVPNERFLGTMAEGYFHAVQYVRHPSMPLYTPEPDVLHDVFGHGIHLTDPSLADLYRTVGRAATRVHSADALDLISRVYWFTLEYGTVLARRGPMAYGAALLSSFGELARFAHAELRPFDLADMARMPYQVAGYQPVLFTVDSLAHLADLLHAFLDDFDEDTRDRHHLPALDERGSLAHPPRP
ncbi:phenylalanine 4-monooxygenase [Embleya scabrispora]|uniref:Phenylalanine 4-monooxygenase n=1 Tax=Embleya scabrispora TaxID=159449 RepID=A0A1T3P6J6_9ACTN|nr:phenylalanine 4-monooxygenase [Embleya scabrispora]OPC84717.1 phenylalanine 4-monooxygenase [Embleya scabrispora]